MDRGRLVVGTHDQPGPVLPWLGNEGRLKSIKNWLRTYQGMDPERPREEQTQQRAFYDGVVLKNSDEMRTNWGDYYQNRLTLRDSRTARTTVKQPQAPPQEKNVRPGDYIQIRSRSADKTAKARKRKRLSDPWRQS